MATQWRNSVKSGFSRRCCQAATRVPTAVFKGIVGKCGVHCHQLEAIGFTQSWIVVVHFSPAGRSGRVGKDTIVKLKCKWAEFAADESGATAIEYGLIAAGIALAIIEIIYALGTNLVAKLQALATALK
ncbi:Flp pilus assembly pilin Flp [Bradyrhizobium sp. SBR1B]|nr:Flp pilus assembly pilin Flp [Bradyrhizobium sp. SBR1B]